MPGPRPKAGYTVEKCIRDYLDQALPGRRENGDSVELDCADDCGRPAQEKFPAEVLSTEEVAAILGQTSRRAGYSRRSDLDHLQRTRGLRRELIGTKNSFTGLWKPEL